MRPKSKKVIKFKTYWEIQKNWQLLFPTLGIIVLAYSSYKLSLLLNNSENIIPNLLISAIVFYLLLKFTLFIFNKLENKWEVNYRWEMIRIFLVFAFTGTSSVFVGRPILVLIGITKENLNSFLYWIIYFYWLYFLSNITGLYWMVIRPISIFLEFRKKDANKIRI